MCIGIYVYNVYIGRMATNTCTHIIVAIITIIIYIIYLIYNIFIKIRTDGYIICLYTHVWSQFLYLVFVCKKHIEGLAFSHFFVQYIGPQATKEILIS